MSATNGIGDVEWLLMSGDERCLELLFDRYYRALCAYAMRYSLSVECAEDIVQSVFISFWNNKQGQPFHGSARAYLFGAVSKAALQWVRDHGRVYFEDIEGHVDRFLCEMFSPEEESAWDVLQEKLYAALERLPGQQQQVVRLVIWGGKTYKEAAEELGISVNTLKTYYVRALQNLRQQLDGRLLFLLVLLYARRHAVND